MPRRNRYARPLVYALGGLVAVVAVVGIFKSFGRDRAEAKAQATPAIAANPTPSNTPPSSLAPSPAPVKPQQPIVVVSAPTAPAATPAVASSSKKAPHPPVALDAPSTRPAFSLTPRATPSTPVDAPTLLKSVDSKIAADELLGARDELVAALDGKKFSGAERDSAFERLQKVNDTVVFGPRKFLSDAHQTAYTVVAGDTLQKIANKFDVTVGFLQRVNGISRPEKLRLGANLKIIKGPFHAVVNKTTFTLDLYQGQPSESGSVFLRRLYVGLGENDSTPTGLWKIGTKLVNPTYYNSRDTGPRVIASGDPANPLGERWLALEGLQGQAVGKESYGIHGTIDPGSIGKKMSMGCVRLLNDDVNLVYDMLIKEKSTVTVEE